MFSRVSTTRNVKDFIRHVSWHCCYLSRIFQNKILTEIRLFAVMLDECVVQGPSICKNGKCTDLAEGYMCTCNKGYKRLDKNTCVG